MSRFSGKYDIYDCMELDGGFEAFERRRNGKLYKIVGNREVEIRFGKYKDLVKYFPYKPIDEFWVNGYAHTFIEANPYIDTTRIGDDNAIIFSQFEAELRKEYKNADSNYYVYSIENNLDIPLGKFHNETECLDCISNFLQKHKCKMNKFVTTVVNDNELLIDNNDDTYYFKVVIKTI